MPMEVPDNPKTYTKMYQNFAGVDYTNDPSNVWYRRTPDGVNMLPDESGRPFKRTGWKKEITAQDFADMYATDTGQVAPSEIEIRKCYYFELSGQDHIVIFTNYGVFIYRDGELLSSKSIDAQNSISYDPDLIDAYDRAFFFEGGGKSAFYTYGGFKIWEYGYSDEDGFTWQEVEPYIPRINITVDPHHEAGEAFETVNMLSDFIAEDFQSNYYTHITSQSTNVSGATLTVKESQFLAMIGSAGSGVGTYTFSYSATDHTWLLDGDKVAIKNYGITLSGTPADGNKIIIVVGYEYRVDLPRRIAGITGMRVIGSVNTQFDTELTLQDVQTHQSAEYCTLITPSSGNSHIKFYRSFMPLVEGEDSVRVIYPRNAVTTTNYDTGEITMTVSAGV